MWTLWVEATVPNLTRDPAVQATDAVSVMALWSSLLLTRMMAHHCEQWCVTTVADATLLLLRYVSEATLIAVLAAREVTADCCWMCEPTSVTVGTASCSLPVATGALLLLMLMLMLMVWSSLTMCALAVGLCMQGQALQQVMQSECLYRCHDDGSTNDTAESLFAFDFCSLDCCILLLRLAVV